MNAALAVMLLIVPGQSLGGDLVDLRGEMPLLDALAELEKQTGNRIVDQRLQKTNRTLKLDVAKATFWQALDVVAGTANIRYSPYHGAGLIALVDGPYRRPPASYSGPFRVSVRGISLSNDLENNTRSCTATVELAWEPRLRPFYLDGAVVAQRNAVEIPVSLPAPAPSGAEGKGARGISFAGKFSLIAPTKMLTFRFDGLKPMKSPGISKVQEGVAVNLAQVAVASDRWSFDAVITNPPGGPEFESFQHWLHNNSIYLEKGTGDTRQIFKPNLADEQQLDIITATRAAIRYHFSHRGRTADEVGELADWTLVYETPGRIVQVEIPYDFKDVPLP